MKYFVYFVEKNLRVKQPVSKVVAPLQRLIGNAYKAIAFDFVKITFFCNDYKKKRCLI